MVASNYFNFSNSPITKGCGLLGDGLLRGDFPPSAHMVLFKPSLDNMRSKLSSDDWAALQPPSEDSSKMVLVVSICVRMDGIVGTQ